MKIELILDGKEKIYMVPFIKSRMYRKLLVIKKSMDFTNIGEVEMDELVGFVCEIFNGQFTIDEFYEGLPVDKLMPTLMNAMNEAGGNPAAERGDGDDFDKDKKK
ncbi:hypothetical protein FQ087_18685 [Sporosarcina sp. ANT_H38]|uniref:phage tail assembly chaperone G n=1 Tax=Sporosarcina sp. ANT_H38 TaxID=2597358 RepID=UPI0011F26A31|nr:hypothetical protein [Sporosarcina sp. ANT_H38]KAA0944152.1 hypothetical protein FQ087_18685 [Sporosarcina sp. ANT_H38]